MLKQRRLREVVRRRGEAVITEVVPYQVIFAALIANRFKAGFANIIPDDTARHDTVCHAT